jgi:2-oxoglutarate ferredoxin oxidoreductase subunit alpha
VLLMSDEVVGHMTEKVVIPPPERLTIVARRETQLPPDQYRPFAPEEDLVPQMVTAGRGYRIHVTGLTHDERGYPAVTADVQQRTVPRLLEKVRRNAARIIRLEEDGLEGAEVIVVCYGITARVAYMAVERARAAGRRVGFLRLITVWPFPEARIRELAAHVKGFVVPEINLGQMVREVERCAAGQARTLLVPNAGGEVHDPQTIRDAIEEVLR